MKILHLVKKIIPVRLRTILLQTITDNKLLLPFTPAYNQDGLITAHNSDFMKDELFKRSYDLAVREGLHVSDKIHWRAHVVCWAASIARNLEGDFVECGVNKGFLSRIVMEYIGFKDLKKTFYLMDTFEGFSEKYLTDKEKNKLKKWKASTGGDEPWYRGFYNPCYKIVIKAFSDFNNVRIIRGPIPDTLPEATPQKVAYLSIDMNCVIPEIAAAEYFWDKMVPGAIMVLDDYGWAGHEEQKKAFDEFGKRKGVAILSLPTGQGLIIKQ